MSTSFKFLLTISLILVSLGGMAVYSASSLGKLRIIACDVGQGDGLLIVTPSGKQVMVDSGSGVRISDCLSQNIPFWDRKIELIVPTHAQKDHMEGFLEVFKRYEVEMIAVSDVDAKSELWSKFLESASFEGSRVYRPRAGDKLIVDEADGKQLVFEILWPVSLQVDEWKERPPADLNETSTVFKLVLGDFCAYFTGDIPEEILENVTSGSCEVLKVAHHGSDTGTNAKIVDLVKPKVAIIQVGKKNSYGHPHKSVLEELSGVNILRTDINGDFEVIADGISVTIKD